MNSEKGSEMVESGEKVVIIGDASVGKTSIILRYVNNSFSDNIKPTIGCDHYEKEVEFGEGLKLKLSIWDTAGQERFRGLSTSYYKKAKCVLLVFDITKKSSFDKMEYWNDEIANFADADTLVVVVGNKSDLKDKRTVPEEEIKRYVDKNKFFYLETSALENSDQHIQKVFEHIAKTLFEKAGLSARDLKSENVGEKGEVTKLDGKKKDGDGCSC